MHMLLIYLAIAYYVTGIGVYMWVDRRCTRDASRPSFQRWSNRFLSYDVLTVIFILVWPVWLWAFLRHSSKHE
jgi:hypothetical protein